MTEPHQPEDLLEFPCQFQFKAVGISDATFRDGILAAVRTVMPVPEDAVHCKSSGKGNYQSVSVLVELHNFEQMRDAYAAMKKVPGLKMLL